MNIDKMSLAMRQQLIGLAKQLYGEGFTTREVAAKLCVSEATVRSIKKIINKANENKTE
jgi:transposase